VVGIQYFGVVTSKKSKGFGLRLHLTATADQVVDAWLLAPASAGDARVLDALVQDCGTCRLSVAKPTTKQTLNAAATANEPREEVISHGARSFQVGPPKICCFSTQSVV
jgi:hypothetical protein